MDRQNTRRPNFRSWTAHLAIGAAVLAVGGWSAAFAADTPYIPVGQAKTKKTVIAFPPVRAVGDKANGPAKLITDIVTNDLTFMDLFRFLSPSAFIEPPSAGLTPDKFKYSDWSSIGGEILIKAAVTVEGANLVLEAYLYDSNGSKQLLAKRYTSTAAEARTVAHTFANQVVETLTGLTGIFLTKIAMVCDRGGQRKELYAMNFDGTDIKQITQHHSTVVGPSWSPDGTRIAYSVYTKNRQNIKNLDLFEYNFTSSTIRMLSNRKGLNMGAAYAPDGGKIALTMNFLGNPEIFVMQLGSNSVERLTKSFGFDVDPTWSPDGKSLAFISTRSGAPMVYSMKADGSQAQRLTYAGQLNATPSWSPANNKIAFAGWLEKHFDIFIMNPDGTNIERLTKDQGGNENPHFSPDGNFVTFDSNRAGQRNVYVMNVDGTFVKRLTYGLGNCTTPKWGNPPAKAK